MATEQERAEALAFPAALVVAGLELIPEAADRRQVVQHLVAYCVDLEHGLGELMARAAPADPYPRRGASFALANARALIRWGLELMDGQAGLHLVEACGCRRSPGGRVWCSAHAREGSSS